MRWTLALALCAVALFVAALPRASPAVPEVASASALLALLLAVSTAVPSWHEWRARPWPWQRPSPVRGTVAQALALIALAVATAAWLPGDGGARAKWALPIINTLLLASALASPRRSRGDRALWAFAAGVSWMWSPLLGP